MTKRNKVAGPDRDPDLTRESRVWVVPATIKSFTWPLVAASILLLAIKIYQTDMNPAELAKVIKEFCVKIPDLPD